MILTDDEIDSVYSRLCGETFEQALRSIDFARAVEAAILEKIGKPVAYRHLHEDGWEYYDAPTGEDCDGCVPLYALPGVKK